MIDYAITHRLTPFISMQNHYSLLYREEEREMFPTLKVRALHFAGMPLVIAHVSFMTRCLASALSRGLRSAEGCSRGPSGRTRRAANRIRTYFHIGDLAQIELTLGEQDDVQIPERRRARDPISVRRRFSSSAHPRL